LSNVTFCTFLRRSLTEKYETLPKMVTVTDWSPRGMKYSSLWTLQFREQVREEGNVIDRAQAPPSVLTGKA
jgi:hypothetical protein